MNEEQKAACALLGVPDEASQDEIRAACEKLEERYSETNYLGSPLWDMAAEKRARIRAAYELLTRKADAAEETRIPASETAASPASGSVRIRRLLNENELEEAEALLARQPDRETNPEWIYLAGMIAWKRGWLDEAVSRVKQAAAMVPGNAEYKSTLEQLRLKPIQKGKEKRRWKEACGEGICECFCEIICEGLCEGL